jgi:hypothetical protein
MKLLSKKISQISKLVLLYSLVLFETRAQTLVSSDRFIFRIIDRTISQQELNFQLRNLKALHCVYEDSLIIFYFENSFVTDLDKFMKGMPQKDQDVRRYLHQNEEILRRTRLFFKLLRYSEDQKTTLSPELASLIRESTTENKCGSAILYKDSLKTNFKGLIESELYLRTRYGNQMKSLDRKSFDVIRSSIDLFMDSLDKQFTHEYYW